MACETPYLARPKGEQYTTPVPCGKCPNCLSRRASGWSFRLMQQGKDALSARFITLTYDTRTVPITERGFMSLDKKHCQDFFKRLRKAHERYPVSDSKHNIKYFLVGEYGSIGERPHYHAILFNARVELIQDAWGMGSIHYGNVSEASIGYTLKYMMKFKPPRHENDDRVPEFQLMSKGLGLPYLTPQMVRWHKMAPADRMYLNLEGGKKCSMPRYYKDKIFDEYERDMAAKSGLEKAQKKFAEYQADMQSKYGDQWTSYHCQTIAAKFKKMYADAQKGRTKL